MMLKTLGVVFLIGAAVGSPMLPKGSAEFECEFDGIFADPENCQAFYDCANAFPYHMTCPDGDLFDDKLMICNFFDQVDCGDRPIPGQSTTSPNTDETTTESPTPTDQTTPESTTESTTVTTQETTTQTTQTTPETTQTTEMTTPGTTTTHHGGSGMPDKIVGMYILLADETEEGYGDDDEWEPQLYEYQQEGANVLFFTFIHPGRMQVPKSFQKLAATRGTGAPGAVPASTKIIFAIGGYLYSINPNPWPFLTSKEAAEEMAITVAGWRQYGCDGIDLDLEEGAGSAANAGPNMVHFVRKLKQLAPEMIVSQPVYGYPQVQAEIDVVNESWTTSGTSTGIADTIGIMVYEGAQSLNYVKNYAHGTDQWEGFPIKVDVTISDIVCGVKGSGSASSINTLATESVKQDLRGIMVWYASVKNGDGPALQYEKSWDASLEEGSQQAYVDALKLMTG